LVKGKLVDGAQASKFTPPSFEDSPSAAPGKAGGRRSAPTAADVEREARDRGIAAGEKAGAEKVALEAAPLLTGLRSAAGALKELREQVLREAESQVVDLAVAIARRIVIEELSQKPERIAVIVKEAIRRIERTGPVTIKVHPELYDLIARLRADIADAQTEILLDVDPSVPPAGPIVTGTTEEVLTDVDEQIRAIVEELRSVRAAQ